MKTGYSDYEYQRRKRMAEMLEKTRRKLDGLVSEARRYGMLELLTNEEAFPPDVPV